jgi:uncharacterized protein YggE
MADTIITVQGEHSAWYPAERATVHAGVQTDGPDRDEVFARAVASADAVRQSIEPLADAQAGPITWWSADSVRVWSQRPWNNEGTQLPLVYSAALDVTAKFSDFAALSRWVETVATIEGVTVGSIQWALTDATRTSVTAEVRSRAVKDAVQKATVYAQSIGLGKVTAIALADPGMLGDPSSAAGGFAPQGGAFRAMKADAMMAPGAPELALKPEDIAVQAAVDARFIAS